MSGADTVALYPRYCFHLAPTANKWCPLHAREIHDLDQHAGFEGENFYFHKNIPIKWVRIVGVVVGRDDIAGRRFYYVDDSSGMTIQALLPLSLLGLGKKKKDGEDAAPAKGKGNDRDDQDQNRDHGHDKGTRQIESGSQKECRHLADIDVGSVVDIKGSVSTFRDERQINIERMELVRGTAQELVLWEKRARFRRDVLVVPWVLTEGEIRRCRKEAERSGEARSERNKRRQERRRRHQDRREQRSSTAAKERDDLDAASHVSHAGHAKGREQGQRQGNDDSRRHEERPRVSKEADGGLPQGTPQHGATAGIYSALGL